MSSVARVGKAAPQWTAEAVVGVDFKTVSLSDYKGKYVVLLFYPLGMQINSSTK
jgi:peroxiredoxin (alkyl hydroperoxide reductase subunit C)